MWRVRSIVVFAVVVANFVVFRGTLAADTPRMFHEATAEAGELKYIEGIPILFLAGEPGQMGRQQAALVFDVARRFSHLPKTVMAGMEARPCGRSWSDPAAA